MSISAIRIPLSILSFTFFVILSYSAYAIDNSASRVALTKYFISAHQAIPLFNTGAVKSGEVIQLPNENRRLSRSDCYKISNTPDYYRINSENIYNIGQSAAAASVNIPVELANIAASVGGTLNASRHLQIDPLSEDDFFKYGLDLWKPKTDKKCDLVRDILSGHATNIILVTRVFYGNMKYDFDIEISAKGDLSVDLNKKVSEVVGVGTRAEISASGNKISVSVTKSPKNQNLSLAVQSAVINIDELTRIYVLFQEKPSTRAELERLVDEYIGSNDTLYDSLKKQIDTLLNEIGIETGERDKFYNKYFSGEKVLLTRPENVADIPREYFEALALTAAANEALQPEQ